MFSEWYGYGFIVLARLFQDHQQSSRFLIWITLRYWVLFVNFDELKVTATMKKNCKSLALNIATTIWLRLFWKKWMWENDYLQNWNSCKILGFSRDLTILVHRRLAKNAVWEFDSIIMTKFEGRFAIVLYTNIAVSSREWKLRLPVSIDWFARSTQKI
mgnify:CR=1 FL=1